MSFFFFFFKQKTAYEMRISDWSSDVCSSDLQPRGRPLQPRGCRRLLRDPGREAVGQRRPRRAGQQRPRRRLHPGRGDAPSELRTVAGPTGRLPAGESGKACGGRLSRSEEHTSELQSLMRISYAAFCLKTKKKQ